MRLVFKGRIHGWQIQVESKWKMQSYIVIANKQPAGAGSRWALDSSLHILVASRSLQDIGYLGMLQRASAGPVWKVKFRTAGSKQGTGLLFSQLHVSMPSVLRPESFQGGWCVCVCAACFERLF